MLQAWLICLVFIWNKNVISSESTPQYTDRSISTAANTKPTTIVKITKPTTAAEYYKANYSLPYHHNISAHRSTLQNIPSTSYVSSSATFYFSSTNSPIFSSSSSFSSSNTPILSSSHSLSSSSTPLISSSSVSKVSSSNVPSIESSNSLSVKSNSLSSSSTPLVSSSSTSTVSSSNVPSIESSNSSSVKSSEEIYSTTRSFTTTNINTDNTTPTTQRENKNRHRNINRTSKYNNDYTSRKADNGDAINSMVSDQTCFDKYYKQPERCNPNYEKCCVDATLTGYNRSWCCLKTERCCPSITYPDRCCAGRCCGDKYTSVCCSSDEECCGNTCCTNSKVYWYPFFSIPTYWAAILITYLIVLFKLNKLRAISLTLSPRTQ